MRHLLAIVFFLSGEVFLPAEDWPRWRGPRGDGSWQAPKLAENWPEDGLRRVWKKPISPGYAGVLTPITERLYGVFLILLNTKVLSMVRVLVQH